MNEAERDAWLAELWPVCRELSKAERAAKRQSDWEQRVEQDLNAQAVAAYPPESTVHTVDMHKMDAA